jgi:hypothetical protein
MERIKKRKKKKRGLTTAISLAIIRRRIKLYCEASDVFQPAKSFVVVRFSFLQTKIVSQATILAVGFGRASSLSLSQNEWMCVCVCVYIVGYSGRVSQRLAWVNKQAVALRLDSRWKRANADACHFLFLFILLCASIRYCCQQLCDCHSAAACCPQSRRMAQSFCSLRWDGYCV